MKAVVNGMPQMARDGLQSHLCFTAKDDTADPAVRRELLATVAVLEREPVNEVEACGVRYRVVRGDEFARVGDGGLEPPRPTDPERRSGPGSATHGTCHPGTSTSSWIRPHGKPGRQHVETGVAGVRVHGARFLAGVRADSERAVATHPELVLLPTGFGVVEGNKHGWLPCGTLVATPHDARRLLYGGPAEVWALLYQFDHTKKARYAKPAEEALGGADEFQVADRVFRICRVERMLRTGPNGPETPRPSDVDEYGTMKMYPTMDPKDGTLTYE
ncbi:DUF5954 family protein [Streptomyces sp. NPDC006602]|uniref:DUF5954 family protein n=1 Tax=Streptomyces sp. NPDC006602 TaxID=3364751 RepID=UPI00369C2227